MLNIFRQGGFTKSLMGGVVILIAAAFILDARGGSTVAPVAECVVRVDESCVPVKDYNFLMRLVAPAGATNKQLRKAGFSDHALQALIERELLLQEARRLGIAVSEEDVDKELATGRVHYSWPVDAPVPMALMRGSQFPVTGAAEPMSYIRVKNSKTGAFDYDIYTRQVRSLLRMSPKDFKNLQREELAAARVRALVTSPVRVSEEEAFAQFDLARSEVTVRHVEAKTSWFERVGGDISDAAAKAFAEKHKEAVSAEWDESKDNWKADCPMVSEVLRRFPPGADSEERAEQNKLADAASNLLKAGADFATVARVYSDASSAKVGGELGCLDASYGAVADDLLKAVADMKPGQVSAPIETAQGFHLLKFHGNLAADAVESTGRLAVACRLMAAETATERAKKFLADVVAAGKQGKELADVVEPLAKAAVALDLPKAERDSVLEYLVDLDTAPVLEISRAFTRNASAIPGLKDSSAVAEIFKLEKDGDFLAEPLETYRGFVAIQLKEKDLVSREDFESEKDELMRGLQEQKRSDALSAYLARLRKRATRIELDESLGKDNTAQDTGESGSEGEETSSG